VIILTVFYVYFDVSYINVLIDGMNKNENEKCSVKVAFIAYLPERIQKYHKRYV
jgi:hypothetical protein